MRTRTLLLLPVLAVVAGGCSTVTTGSTSVPSSLSADCQRTYQALTSMQKAAGSVSHTVWNTPVTDLTGAQAALRDELLADGANGSLTIAVNYSSMASGPWASCGQTTTPTT